MKINVKLNGSYLSGSVSSNQKNNGSKQIDNATLQFTVEPP